MGVDEFYDMLPREFWNRVDGFIEIQNLKDKNEWERTRWSTCILLNIQLGKGKKIKPTDIIEFDWDKKDRKIDFKKIKEKADYMKKLDEFERNKKLENGE